MKNNTLHFVSFFCTSLAIAIALVMLAATGTAKAENNVSNLNTIPHINESVLNGLYSPTAAERFFEEGRRNIEREIEVLANPERHRREGILKIDTIDIKKMEGEIIMDTKPIYDSPEDSLQNDLG